jgi:hypothetical protein
MRRGKTRTLGSMEDGRPMFTGPVLGSLVVLWIVGTAAASLYPGLLVADVGIGLLAIAMVLLAWRNKTLLFIGGFSMNRTEVLVATAGGVLFLSFVTSGFVIPLLK